MNLPLKKYITLEHIPCDLCGSEKYKLLFHQPDFWLNGIKTFQYQFPVVRCLNCGLIFVNPRPTRESMSFFYPETYHDERLPEIAGSRYAAQAKFLPPIHPGCRILDIGCAKGDFLHWLGNSAAPFEAYGCDSFSDGIRDGYGIKFMPAELPECGFSDNYFDLITAWAVFEHVHAPSSYFREIERILKPGGKFIFLVPNGRSLYALWARFDDIPRHIYLFTEQSIAQYASKNGLTVGPCEYTDAIFDGRGHGTCARTLWRLAGGAWSDELNGKSSWLSRLAYRYGERLDRCLFKTHWEANRHISGMMVITLRKG